MTQIEMKYLELVPLRLAGIEKQIKELNNNLEKLIKMLNK